MNIKEINPPKNNATKRGVIKNNKTYDKITTINVLKKPKWKKKWNRKKNSNNDNMLKAILESTNPEFSKIMFKTEFEANINKVLK
jgi:hypothetical protein